MQKKKQEKNTQPDQETSAWEKVSELKTSAEDVYQRPNVKQDRGALKLSIHFPPAPVELLIVQLLKT